MLYELLHLGYNTFLCKKGEKYDKNYKCIVPVHDALRGAS